MFFFFAGDDGNPEDFDGDFDNVGDGELSAPLPWPLPSTSDIFIDVPFFFFFLECAW